MLYEKESLMYWNFLQQYNVLCKFTLMVCSPKWLHGLVNNYITVLSSIRCLLSIYLNIGLFYFTNHKFRNKLFLGINLASVSPFTYYRLWAPPHTHPFCTPALTYTHTLKLTNYPSLGTQFYYDRLTIELKPQNCLTLEKNRIKTAELSIDLSSGEQ